MAPVVLTNAFSFVHGYDFSTDINQLMLDATAEALEATTFGSGGWKTFVGGLKSWSYNQTGLLQLGVGSVDTEMFADLATANRVYTVGEVQTETNPAYMCQGGKFKLDWLGKQGELAPFALDCYNTDGVGIVRGQLAKAKGNVSATGQLGSVLNLGAPSSTQYVYATLHVMSAGTTITVQVQSDDNAGMSSPTTRGTIGPITSAGGTWMTRVAGPFAAETHWRLNVSAITGTFTIAGAIGVQ